MCRKKPVARAGSAMRRTVTTDQSLLDLTMTRALALVRHGRTSFFITAEQAAHHEQVYESQCLSFQISMEHIIVQEHFPIKQLHYRHCEREIRCFLAAHQHYAGLLCLYGCLSELSCASCMAQQRMRMHK